MTLPAALARPCALVGRSGTRIRHVDGPVGRSRTRATIHRYFRRAPVSVKVAVVRFLMTTADLRDFLLRNPGPHPYATLVGLASRHGVRDAVNSGDIVRLLPDRYASSVHGDSWTVRTRAALSWAGSSAAIDGLSALTTWGAADPPSHTHIEVATGRHRPSPIWLKLRSASYPIDRWLTAQGDAVVAPAHAVIRAYAMAPPRDQAELVYRAFRTQIVTASVLRAALDATPRVRGRGALLRLESRASSKSVLRRRC